MKIEVLSSATRTAALDLGGARGVVAFVSDSDTVWREYLAAIRAAMSTRGRLRGRGPVVRGGSGAVTVGSGEFESLLGSVIEAHALRRDEFAAVWLGTGAAETWVSAAVALLLGPETTRRTRGWGGRAPVGDASAAAWLQTLIRKAASDVRRLTRAQAGTADLEARWRELREAAAVKQGDAEAAAMAWVRERQDAETRLLLYRDRERELRGRLSRIRDVGADASCANCGRALGDRADAVEQARREEWEDVVQDGKWWRRRRDQLELKPDELREIESDALSLNAEIEDLSEELERRKVEALELAAATERLERLRELKSRTEGSGGGPAGDPDRDETRRLVETARKRVRAKVHAKLVALTGGRFAGTFPELYAEWVAGNQGSGEATAALEISARIALAEIALDAGMELGSVLLSAGLERLNDEDLPRALADLARLAKRIPLALVKATPAVAAGAPESFDLLYRLQETARGARIRRQSPGLATLWLQGE